MNLIEQQNVLRNLPDEALSTAMQGGGMPPYLVLTEINRRKQVREHYLSQKQKYDASQPSVAAQTVQDFAASGQGMMPPGAMPSGGIDAAAVPMDMGASPAPAGIDAAAPEGFKNGGSVPGYANGTGPSGIQMSIPRSPVTSLMLSPAVPTTARDLSMTPVYSDPYASLREYFASQAGAMDKEREQAQAMALIAAGLGIAGGKSQNFARNLAGALPALEGYQKQMGDISQQERQFGLERAKLDAQSAAEKLAFEQGTPEYKLKQLIGLGFSPDDPNMKYYLSGLTPPSSRENVPDIMQTYEYYVEQEEAAGRTPKTFEQYAAEQRAGGGATGAVTVNPDGSISINPGKVTEQQANIMTYVNKGYSAAPTLDEFDQNLTDPAPKLLKTFGGDVGKFAANYFKSSDYRKAEQAGREFVAAMLRRESGAAVTDSEFANYQETYLPIPGDDDAVIAQKSRARANALLGLELGLTSDQLDYIHAKGVRADEYAKSVLNKDPAVVDSLTQKSDAAVKLGITPAPGSAAELPAPLAAQGVTEDDIAETMRANGLTRDEVIKRLTEKLGAQ